MVAILLDRLLGLEWDVNPQLWFDHVVDDQLPSFGRVVHPFPHVRVVRTRSVEQVRHRMDAVVADDGRGQANAQPVHPAAHERCHAAVGPAHTAVLRPTELVDTEVEFVPPMPVDETVQFRGVQAIFVVAFDDVIVAGLVHAPLQPRNGFQGLGDSSRKRARLT